MFFANSGAEANECAIKLARRYGQANGGPERYHVLSALGSFHGRTLTDARGHRPAAEAGDLPAAAVGVPAGGLRRPRQLVAAMDERVCAVMLEPIQGEGGVLPSPPGYLEAVRALCDEREALLVIDEVQTGLGRTGKWFGFQHAPGVDPDIVSMAKALGNGVPIGACWARDDVAAAFKPGDHATTYGGQPLAARAALTVLEVMERIDAPACANHAGRRLSEGLAATPGVVAVRGAGLILGAELEPPHEAPRVALALLHAGLVVNAVTPTALRFEPSLLVTDDEIDAAGRAGTQGSAGGRRMKPRHFLEVDDLTPAEFREVLDNASRWKHSSVAVPQHLEGLGVALLFEKPSVRTRSSTEMAVFTLGGHPMYIRSDEVGLGVRESVADVARTMNALCSVIAARVFDHGTLEEMASVAEIPVVNLLSDRAHPCQAVADFLTLQELVGDLEGRKLVFVGDGNNVAASLAYAAALSGVELTVASPLGYELDDVTVDRARNLRWGHRARSRSPRSGARRRRGLHRRVDVDGTGRRIGRPACRVRRLSGECGADGGGGGAGVVPALPARAPRRGSDRRGDRWPAQRSVATGWQPHGRGAARFLRFSWRRNEDEGGRPGRRNGADPATGRGLRMATLGKPQRQHRIPRLLEEQAISSQAQLVEMLASDGVVATQATVSRDLEELGAVKVRIPGGAMAYAIPEHAKEGTVSDDHLRRVIGEFVVEVAQSANLVVLRTPPGSAHVVGSAIDRAGLPDILGTVAGDDTILVVCSETVGGAPVAAELASLAGL